MACDEPPHVISVPRAASEMSRLVCISTSLPTRSNTGCGRTSTCGRAQDHGHTMKDTLDSSKRMVKELGHSRQCIAGHCRKCCVQKRRDALN